MALKGLPFLDELETRSLESERNKIYQSANGSGQDLKCCFRESQLYKTMKEMGEYH